MELSLIELDDADTVNKMEGRRSIAYFCREKPARVSGRLVEQLKQAADQAGDLTMTHNPSLSKPH